MSRIFRPRPKDAPYIEDVRADKRTLQKGMLNDPVTQDGRLYLNAAKTAYLYLEDDDLFFQPASGTRVQLS